MPLRHMTETVMMFVTYKFAGFRQIETRAEMQILSMIWFRSHHTGFRQAERQILIQPVFRHSGGSEDGLTKLAETSFTS